MIVHLFEWQWNDIAAECEDYLGHSDTVAAEALAHLEPAQKKTLEVKKPRSVKVEKEEELGDLGDGQLGFPVGLVRCFYPLLEFFEKSFGIFFVFSS